jgi:acyl carrier protein
MSKESGVRDALRRWIAQTSGKASADELADDTPLFRSGILKSVQVTDLILYIEELSERPVDIESIKPGVFRDIDTIYESFFGSSHA